MEPQLKESLHQYLAISNSDLLIHLQEKSRLNDYLEEKVASVTPLMDQLLEEDTPVYIVEERCMHALTFDLQPSTFSFLKTILEEEFEAEHEKMKKHGLLTTEVINMAAAYDSVFQTFGLTSGNEQDRYLRYAITGAIRQYLDGGD